MIDDTSSIVKEIDSIVYDLCGILFSGSSTALEVLNTFSKVSSFIGCYQFLFYYNVVPILTVNKIIKSKDIAKNMYMLRLIKKSLLNKSLINQGTPPLIKQYYNKFKP